MFIQTQPQEWQVDMVFICMYFFYYFILFYYLLIYFILKNLIQILNHGLLWNYMIHKRPVIIVAKCTVTLSAAESSFKIMKLLLETIARYSKKTILCILSDMYAKIYMFKYGHLYRLIKIQLGQPNLNIWFNRYTRKEGQVKIIFILFILKWIFSRIYKTIKLEIAISICTYNFNANFISEEKMYVHVLIMLIAPD